MARQIRLEFPGACYHVINRGNYRRDLFAMKGAAEAFEQVLFEAAARCAWRVHAYVIMGAEKGVRSRKRGQALHITIDGGRLRGRVEECRVS